MTDTCDILICGGIVVDGTGAPAIKADVAISDDKIVGVGDLTGMRSRDSVDASGRVVSPGFIDVHTHDDRLVLEQPEMTPKVSQGVTTVVTGNCGVSLAPYTSPDDPPPPMNLLGTKEWYRFDRAQDYVDTFSCSRAATNVVMLCGHSSLRASVMDELDRPATVAEIKKMIRMLEEALDAGFVGLSTGLAYPTALAAPTEEVIELACVAADRGGLHTSHMRDEEDHVHEAIDETVRIGRQARCASVISHFKVCGTQNYGRTRETLEIVQKAQKEMALDIDVYPYIASSTVLLPSFVERAERVLITWSTPHADMAGRDLHDIAAGWDVSIKEAIDRLNPAGAIYFQMHEEDLIRVLINPGTMIGTDGLPHDSHPHPRLWGTFPRVLGRYVREQGVLSLEQAIHRMSGKPAQVFGLSGRGVIEPGAYADLTVFNDDEIADTATFDNPVRPAQGIGRVMTNGRWVWHNGCTTGERPGKQLRRTVVLGSC